MLTQKPVVDIETTIDVADDFHDQIEMKRRISLLSFTFSAQFDIL